jgi:hypothetical protein
MAMLTRQPEAAALMAKILDAIAGDGVVPGPSRPNGEVASEGADLVAGLGYETGAMHFCEPTATITTAKKKVGLPHHLRGGGC